MSVDKNYCMSSYLALRYVADDDKDFFPGLRHPPAVETVPPDLCVYSAREIDEHLRGEFQRLAREGKKLGILLSGGMDSACLASYLPEGTDAYTFRFLGGAYQREEMERARRYAERYGLNLHYVDISWADVEESLPELLRHRMEPIHSIEPQLLKACRQAKADGVQRLLYGGCVDSAFGGLDKMLSHEWGYEEFIQWYTFLDPAAALNEPVDMREVFEPYRRGDKIDYIGFMNGVFHAESGKSFYDVFDLVGIEPTVPYERLKTELDLARIRAGESKYLIRELFAMRYPGIPVPEKLPMPRPVDAYFKDWEGPKRPEFRADIDMSRLTGNQKWQLWCLEYFLNMFDPV